MALDPRHPLYLAVSALEWARIQRENRIPGTMLFHTDMGHAEKAAKALHSDEAGPGVVVKFETFLLSNTYKLIEEADGMVRVAVAYIDNAIGRIVGFFEVRHLIEEIEDLFGLYADGK